MPSQLPIPDWLDYLLGSVVWIIILIAVISLVVGAIQDAN